MFRELNREMNDDEKAILNDQVADPQPFVTFRGTLNWSIVWISVLIVCGLFAAVLIWICDKNPLHLDPIAGGLLGGLLAAAIAIPSIVSLYAVIVVWGSYFRWSSAYRHLVMHEIPEIKLALNRACVSVKHVMATAVVEISEFEDEGGGYIYDVGDGRLLFMKGQQYFPVDDVMIWPNSDFEIVRDSLTGRWIGIFCHGSELVPVRVIESSECREEIVWDEREEIVEADIDDFALSLLAKYHQ